MKFNFEKTKEIIKKAALGSAIVTASLSPLKSNSQEIKQGEDNIKNKTEISMDPESYRNEYIKYIEHPSYKQRLTKEMYGDDIIDADKQEIIDSEYEKRLSKIKSVPIEMLPPIDDASKDTSYFSLTTKSIKTTPNASYHELSHSLDYKDNFMTKQKGFQGQLDKYLDNTIEILNSNYLSNRSEIKARLNSLRLKAIKLYGFDLNEDFDINKFEQLRNNKEYLDLRFKLNFNNEQINELMKYTAENITNEEESSNSNLT